MTDEWFAPVAAGFAPLASRLASRDLPGASVEADGDNAIRVRLAEGAQAGGASAPRLLLSYCRGLFRVLGEESGGLGAAARAFARIPRSPNSRGGPRPTAGQRRVVDPRSPRGPSRGRGTFVLRSFGVDDPASIPAAARRAIEELIAAETGLRPDSSRPEREYRLQERSGGRVLFLERITRRGEPGGEAGLRPGELPRTTCRLLAEMTGPRPDDVFLDPFCGYGGIPLERALASPYRFAFAQDIDPEKVTAVKESLGAEAFEKRRRTIFPKARDALDAESFEPGFVSAIATDPPWGLYEGGGTGAAGAEVLLAAFASAAARMLAPGGRLVLLVSRDLAGQISGGRLASRDFEPVERLDVLVSGKKASALRLDRKGRR